MSTSSSSYDVMGDKQDRQQIVPKKKKKKDADMIIIFDHKVLADRADQSVTIHCSSS